MNPFAILGISANSTEKEVRKAYRDLSLRYHPDRAGPGATGMFQKINNAYHTITDRNLCGDNEWQAKEERDRARRARHAEVNEEWEEARAHRNATQARTARSQRSDAFSDYNSRSSTSPPWRTRSPPRNGTSPPSPYSPNSPQQRPRARHQSPDQLNTVHGRYSNDPCHQEPPERIYREVRERHHQGFTDRTYYECRELDRQGSTEHRCREYIERHYHEPRERNYQAYQPRSDEDFRRRAVTPREGSGRSRRGPESDTSAATPDVIFSISRQLLHGLRAEQTRRTYARVYASSELEHDILAAIENVTENRHASSTKVTGTAIGRIVFQLRELRLRYDPCFRATAPRGNMNFFQEMASILGITRLMDSRLYSHAERAFDAENCEDCRGNAEIENRDPYLY